MGKQTAIGWCYSSFNPWIGCLAVSPACDQCYAAARAVRWGEDFATRRRTSAANWRKPLAWDRAAKVAGVRRRVFCASLADVFDNKVPKEWRTDLWALIRATPHLDWLLLTKRPINIAEMLPLDWSGGYPNVWLGTTVENQTEANRRIPYLLEVPAAVHFLSCEPLLGPIDLCDITTRLTGGGEHHFSALPDPDDEEGVAYVDWVITGGESGPGARPTNPQHFRELRDQCDAAGVPFFFKQWGEWVSVSEVEGPGAIHEFGDGRCARRVGTKKAGNTLDGVLHEAFPA